MKASAPHQHVRPDEPRILAWLAPVGVMWGPAKVEFMLVAELARRTAPPWRSPICGAQGGMYGAAALCETHACWLHGLHPHSSAILK